MTSYAIGDVQGCFSTLEALLKKIDFDATQDTLWFAGDLVNRGPRSLDTLRYIKQLGGCAHTVLGNHDLHLLALWCKTSRSHESDTLAQVLKAPDGEELVNWLRQQPLARLLPNMSGSPSLLVHAGVIPQWDFDQALELSAQVQDALANTNWKKFIANLYGNMPNQWSPDLKGYERLRCITNVFTRMRMLHNNGVIDFRYKGKPTNSPSELKPWFDIPRPSAQGEGPIIFGHWSTLGILKNKVGYCLDTGCVWGGSLTALRLEDQTVFQVNAVESS